MFLGVVGARRMMRWILPLAPERSPLSMINSKLQPFAISVRGFDTSF